MDHIFQDQISDRLQKIKEQNTKVSVLSNNISSKAEILCDKK